MIDAAGVLDPTYGVGGKAASGFSGRHGVKDLAMQADNKALVLVDIFPLPKIARYNIDGSLDSAFGNGGIVSGLIGRGSGLVVQPDGKIIVTGSFSTTEGDSDFWAARLYTNGSLDTTFGNNGNVVIDAGTMTGGSFYKPAIQRDGKIVIAGATPNDPNPANRFSVRRLNSNGTPDDAFGAQEVVYLEGQPNSSPDYVVNPRVFISSSGKIITYYLSTVMGRNTGHVFRLNANGSPDTSFDDDGKVDITMTNQSFSAFPQPDEKIIVFTNRSLRLMPDGSVDNAFSSSQRSGYKTLLSNGQVLSARLQLEYLSRNNLMIGRVLAPQESDSQLSELFLVADVQSDNKIVALLYIYHPVRQDVPGHFVLYRYKAITSLANKQVDFDNDDKADYSVFRPSDNSFYSSRSRSPATLVKYTADTEVGFPIIPEDFDGNFASDYIWTKRSQPYNFFCSYYNTFPFQPSCFQWGLDADVSTGGDYDGDNKSDYAIFRNGLWHIRKNSNGESLYFNWGQTGDKPVPADYDYDGITDVAIYRPSTGVWWVLNSSDFTYTAVQFGIGEDKPVAADYDGDGCADFAVYRPSTGVWYLLQSAEGFAAAQFGVITDRPVPGDYDGDGKTDIAVYRASEGNWYLLQSKNGFGVVRWGQNGDVPLSTAYAAE
jgi:uncharacterized delta-60 repeat protein